jgi:hypothetical protein
VLRSPRRALIAGALAATAVASPFTAGERAASGRSVRISRPNAQNNNGTFLYDWREENNSNAPHPPVYYVIRANKGEKSCRRRNQLHRSQSRSPHRAERLTAVRQAADLVAAHRRCKPADNEAEYVGVTDVGLEVIAEPRSCLVAV